MLLYRLAMMVQKMGHTLPGGGGGAAAEGGVDQGSRLSGALTSGLEVTDHIWHQWGDGAPAFLTKFSAEAF